MEKFLTPELQTILLPWYPTIATVWACILVFFCYKKILLMLLRNISDYFDFELGVNILNACEKHIDQLIFLIGFYYTIKQLPYDWTKDLSFIRGVFGSLSWVCVFCCVFKAVNVAKPFLAKLMKNAGITASDTLANILGGIIRIVFGMMCIGLIAKEWNFDIVGFMASVSFISVALAYAGKDALANIFGGFIILVDKSFLQGDWVSINGVEGIVEKISFRSTYIRSFPQEVVVVPNNLLINTPITNYSKRGKRRVYMVMGLTYDTTKEQMQDFIASVKVFLKTNPKIDKEDIRVNFVNYNDSSLDVEIVCFVNKNYVGTPQYLEAVSEINLALMDIVDECGVSCAFPTRSVYLENAQK
ncbi:MAG: mechanosensitive ion channel family protein [Phascolarctobacterium sp.]|nr:mechanosensitive ion channel family protein [Phascolarctobacterium sp.]